MFLKPREQKQKTKESFLPDFPAKNNILIFGYITTKRGVKKRNRVEQKKQKKESKTKRETILQETEEDQTWKIN